ncbi:hypothetical protein KVR01_005028 [Diaporthe batatas]|uniref:uncharacterized protein n=1 Tax=Diaporthe batatas TaxID=748121 RepID=UPI001D047169|nr:uncharacterized protein KVR01_005028 [Diaporthe batatas]KAG8164753.1 hypothetical protein KVR01_005028 [Diaporthe batatas]
MASTSSDQESSTHTSNPTSSSHTSSNQHIVEFYLSSLWSLLPETIKRVIEHLESLELARFVWDEECNWFHIQCLEDDKGHIMNEYFDFQCELEDELKEKGVIEQGGSLMPVVENDLVGTLRCKAIISEDPSEPFQSEHANLRYPKGHSPVKNGNNRHLKGHGTVKTGDIQQPKGRGSGTTTGRCQAPQKKEYGY